MKMNEDKINESLRGWVLENFEYKKVLSESEYPGGPGVVFTFINRLGERKAFGFPIDLGRLDFINLE